MGQLFRGLLGCYEIISRMEEICPRTELPEVQISGDIDEA